MPVTVIPDIHHPSARCNITRQVGDLFQTYDVVRVFAVTGLKTDTGTGTADATTMLSRAIRQKGIPAQFELCPGDPGQAGAVVISYATVVDPAKDDACYVLVNYKNPLPGVPVAAMISDDTVLTVESTQLHPSTKQPMYLYYKVPKLAAAVQPPAGAAKPPGSSSSRPPDPQAKTEQILATFKYSRPIRKVVITAYVIAQNLDPIRAAIGTVNDATWLGYPKGYWRLDEFRDDGVLFGSIYKVTVGVTSRVNENWMQWQVFNSPDLGRRITVQQAVIDKIKNLGYMYGWTRGDNTDFGVTAAGLHPLASFSRVIGLPNGYSVTALSR